MSNVWNLKQLDLFGELDSSSMDQILRIVQVKHIEQGDYIFRPGDPCDHLYLLHHGRVKTYVHSEQGQEKIMHIFHPGDAFGGLLLGVPHGELPWAQALEDVIVSFMDEIAFKKFIRSFPDLCMRIFHYLGEHHAKDMRRLENFIHTDARRRLLLTFLELGNRLGYEEATTFELPSSFTHENLANMIGVVRSTVSEMIGQLRGLEVISGSGRKLVVHRKKIQKLLGSDA